MEPFLALIVAAIGVEAVVQLLRNLWSADVRSQWNPNAIAVFLIVVGLAIPFGPDLMAGTVLDFGNVVIGKLVTGLAVARLAAFVHDTYTKAWMK